ncbi:hypothetical protein [Ciceribacter sp. L1K22]|uniref:hypothetical protein n=1 Tax=Ciceribacter sp. L1K22 TaxID=2820275 RepID=UPI001ABEB842|nr:hypothetical protein [Ciceribacter sp. L1K22]MBO3760226.1 hypothetical protein [Ciceribacter sp. L1K22]
MRPTTILPALLTALLTTGAAHSQELPAIDWGSAGRDEAMSTEPLPQKTAEVPDDGFECNTVMVDRTNFGTTVHERVAGDRDEDLPGLPREVRRCSREGVSFELSPPAP